MIKILHFYYFILLDVVHLDKVASFLNFFIFFCGILQAAFL